jgi:hypothetical protein
MFEVERNDIKEQRDTDAEFVEAFTTEFKVRCGE